MLQNINAIYYGDMEECSRIYFLKQDSLKKFIFMLVLRSLISLSVEWNLTMSCIFLPVTTTQQASVALSMIREQKDHYELVMANINMPDIDILSFLHVLFENEIPVVCKHQFNYLSFPISID